jgi:hypothetical protein
MITKRLGTVGALLCLAALLGACSPFAGFVADHVPHWAGGLPPDAPPRPGAPGYDDFIAHGEPPVQNTGAPESGLAPGAATPTSGATGTVASGGSAAADVPQFQARKAQPGRSQAGPSLQHEPETAVAPAVPVEPPSAGDSSVVKGGLY